jgi:hypothetical protein
VVVRASDDSRRRVVGLLGQRFEEGYLSTDTFEVRADLACTSRDERDLQALVHDLPPARSWRDALDRVLARLRRERPAPAVVVPEPPHDAAGEGLVIGRSPDCALTLADPTVSRRHAELRREGGRWVVADLGSSNGTRVNGWRVRHATLGSGDELMLGAVRVVFSGPRSAAAWLAAPERPLPR